MERKLIESAKALGNVQHESALYTSFIVELGGHIPRVYLMASLIERVLVKSVHRFLGRRRIIGGLLSQARFNFSNCGLEDLLSLHGLAYLRGVGINVDWIIGIVCIDRGDSCESTGWRACSLSLFIKPRWRQASTTASRQRPRTNATKPV
jgi:hypothetical protein